MYLNIGSAVTGPEVDSLVPQAPAWERESRSSCFALPTAPISVPFLSPILHFSICNFHFSICPFPPLPFRRAAQQQDASPFALPAIRHSTALDLFWRVVYSPGAFTAPLLVADATPMKIIRATPPCDT